eukprot:7073635-Alexandrium_andersonii.AAC.1
MHTTGRSLADCSYLPCFQDWYRERMREIAQFGAESPPEFSARDLQWEEDTLLFMLDRGISASDIAHWLNHS